MIKAVLFDLDNTLIDFMKMKRICSEEAISAMIDAGLPLSKEKGVKILYELYRKYGIENQKIFQEFLKKVSGKIDKRILAQGISAYRKVKAGFLKPYPHVVSTLIKLRERGLKLGIVSDAPELQGWIRLADMGIIHFFDTVVTLGETGKKKPSKKPFGIALKKLDLKPEEILFVGEDPKRDIKGARSLGMKTALALYGLDYRTEDKEIIADYEIKDVAQILKIVR
jgi:putative hydrolase of the HAD superfamily